MKAQLEPIFIKLEASKPLMGVIFIISMVCCAVVSNLALVTWHKIGLYLLILSSSFYYMLRDCLLKLPFSWHTIQVNNRGELTITNITGQQFKPQLCANSFIHEYLTVLNFDQPRFKLTMPPVILFNIQHEEMRKLRVWLRWFKHQN